MNSPGSLPNPECQLGERVHHTGSPALALPFSMIRRTYLLLLVGLLVQASASAQPTQSAPNPVAFGMIRATTEFLATDTKAFGKRAVTPCQPCQSYNDLYQFVKQNKLLGADKLIDDARAKANEILKADSTQLASQLKTFLVNRVTDGTHSYRIGLAGFPRYQSALASTLYPSDTLIDPVVADESVAGSDLSDEAADTSSTAYTDSYPSPKPEKTASLMDYLPLLLSILSLVGLGILWFRKTTTASQPVILPDDKINQLASKVARLEDDNRKMQDLLATLRQSVDTQRNAPRQQQPQQPNRPAPMPERLATQPSQPLQAMAAPEPLPPRPAAAAPPVAPPINPHQNPTLFYGRTADLGDGFSVRGLLEKPDRDTVFEILKTDATRATFQVSDEPALQQLALSDVYSYLSDTCIYTAQPKPGTRIRTEKPGTLSLQGEKWVIAEKAHISFLG